MRVSLHRKQKRQRAAEGPSASTQDQGGSAFTVTFGDRAENEAGMQMIGAAADRGVSVARLHHIASTLAGVDCTVVSLDRLLEGSAEKGNIPGAAVLVMRDGVNALLEDPGAQAALLAELQSMPKDTTTLSYGKVRNKHARHNNTMGDFRQEPDIAKGKGTVVMLSDYPTMHKLRGIMSDMVEAPLVGELNHYFDASTCGIGFHGDLERKLVVGVRVGPGANGMPLKFQWYKGGHPIGRTGLLKLNAGDMYIMSEKAVGFDWKKKKILTLRHAAGKDTCKYSRVKRKRGEEAPAEVTLFE